MEQRIISEQERNNKVAMIAHAIEVIVMNVLGLLLVFAGKRAGAFYVMDLVLGLGPVLAEMFFWKKNRETTMIKHLVGYGFAVFYTYTLFTCDNNMMFAFAIPMILMISIFNDMKYSIKINAGAVILGILMNVIGSQNGKMGYEGIDDASIMIVVMALTAIFSVYASKTSYSNSRQKIDEAKEAHTESQRLLDEMKIISERLHDGIRDIYGELEKLSQAAQATQESMTQLSTGASETAEAVQQHTLQVLEEGNKDVEILVSQVEHSVKNGAEVADKLQNLDSYVEEMHSIVNLISGIANQTSMLALNASIEAARAGEAGRGFAVVASQVTGMAAQTKDATVKITELIMNVSTAIAEVVEVIKQMLEGIREEKKSTENTAASFGNIRNNTYTIRENVTHLVQSIDELREANQMISDSIQTISAVTEEVSAHANETNAATEENVNYIDNIDKKMQDLIQYIRL